MFYLAGVKKDEKGRKLKFWVYKYWPYGFQVEIYPFVIYVEVLTVCEKVPYFGQTRWKKKS